jgi:predicted secreted protein
VFVRNPFFPKPHVMRQTISCLLLSLCLGWTLWETPAVAVAQSKSKPSDKFRQLDELLPTPNEYRTASGAPGHRYWQNRADHVISVELDDERQRIQASETITYTNNSPDELRYLWLQLDQNIFARDSDAFRAQTSGGLDRVPFSVLDSLLRRPEFDGGYKITAVKDAKGQPLRYTVVKTMMRVDLPTPLKPGQQVSFAVDWNYNINDAVKLGGRSGYEYFPKDKNYIYEIAQWFPRMCAYTDYRGWQHTQFLGRR